MSTPRPLTGVRVLVVEDDEATRYAWCRYLAFAGATVTDAADGVQARQALQSDVVDVLVLDLVLPDTDGPQLLTESRARLRGLVAIAVTAFDDNERRTQALTAGFAAYLVKPILPSALVQEVARLIGPR